MTTIDQSAISNPDKTGLIENFARRQMLKHLRHLDGSLDRRRR